MEWWSSGLAGKEGRKEGRKEEGRKHDGKKKLKYSSGGRQKIVERVSQEK